MDGTVIVSQLGARMHYAVPRILAEAERLERFHTDICAGHGWTNVLGSLPFRRQPALLRRLAGRIPVGVPSQKITSYPSLGLMLGAGRMCARTPTRSTAASIWSARRFSRRVLKDGFQNAAGFYGFSGECLELIKAARAQGMWTVVEQIIGPRRILDALLAEEHERFPDWEAPVSRDRASASYAAREQEEWSHADLIICGSTFVRDGVIETGGDPNACVVVPYGVDRQFFDVAHTRHNGPLRVLTIGGIGLRKGSPYVLEAALSMRGRAEFRMVGPCNISPRTRRSLMEAVDLVGPVPRSEIHAHYAWADVFLLPSICEGSATVTYEALAAGLPVIATHNTGSVVRDGVDGFIVPIRNASVIVDALDLLCTDRGLLREMAHHASLRAAEFDLHAYGLRLCQALDQHKPGRMSGHGRNAEAPIVAAP